MTLKPLQTPSFHDEPLAPHPSRPTHPTSSRHGQVAVADQKLWAPLPASPAITESHLQTRQAWGRLPKCRPVANKIGPKEANPSEPEAGWSSEPGFKSIYYRPVIDHLKWRLCKLYPKGSDYACWRLTCLLDYFFFQFPRQNLCLAQALLSNLYLQDFRLQVVTQMEQLPIFI